MQYIAIFHCCKNDNFQMKLFDYFHTFAQNIYCGFGWPSGMFVKLDGRRQRTTGGRTPEHEYTISSPGEPSAQVSLKSNRKYYYISRAS